jgi:CBS domain containing-hemolysin-like protein
MSSLLLTLTLLFISTYLILILSAYKFLSINEYKRRARRTDKEASNIYQVLLYGKQLDLVFWLIIGALTSWSMLALEGHLPFFLTIILFAAYFSFVYGILVGQKTKLGLISAKKISPFVSKTMSFIQPVIGRILPLNHQNIIEQKIYEVEDLLSFLKEQKVAVHNRIDTDVLSRAIESILFKEKLVEPSMTPIDEVAQVDIKDDIGPILLEELHSSGHSYFPVYEGKKNNIVGGLYISDILDVKKGGKIKDHVKKDVFYIHKDSSLNDVISAIVKTNQNKFMAIDNTEAIVGLITASDVFRQIIGVINPSELENYKDPEDVISHFSKNQ